MRKTKFYLTIALLSISLSSFAQNWKLAKAKAGIEVYTRNVEGTKYKEIRAEINIKKTPEQLLKELNNYAYIASWRHKVIDMRLLEGDPLAKHLLYFALNIPSPLSDRDFVIAVNTEKEASGAIKIKFEAAKDKLAKQKGRVRMETMEGFWYLEPVETKKNSTKVTYQYLSDPSGVPAWVVNLFSVNAPFQALKKLKAAMENNP